MRRHGISSLRAADGATLDNLSLEALLLELNIDLAKLSQFAGSPFRAIRMNSNCSHHDVQANGANRHTDISWMAELLHEVQRLSDPIPRGEYGRAGPRCVSLALGSATLTGVREDGSPVGNPCAPERAEVPGMLRRWGREFHPALAEGVNALERFAQTCAHLESSYAA